MSCCQCGCDDNRDYWFRLRRRHRFRPIFPRVIQGTVIIPQTAIPVQIVFGGQTGFATTGGASLLQSISLSPQTVVAGGAIPFGTNVINGTGAFNGF
jgi:hypothetical protein